MRYRITKTQAKMLMEGKPLSIGRRKIYADKEVKDIFQQISDLDAFDRFDIFVDDKCGLEIKKKDC